MSIQDIRGVRTSSLEEIVEDIYDILNVAPSTTDGTFSSADSFIKDLENIAEQIKDEKLRAELEDKIVKVSEIVDGCAEGRDIVYDLWQELGNKDIDSWKDLVMSTLPGNCSAAFANDVEEALSKFTNIY